MNLKKFTFDTLSEMKGQLYETPLENCNIYHVVYIATSELPQIIHSMRKYTQLCDSKTISNFEKLLKLYKLNNCSLGYCVKNGFHNERIIRNGRCPKCGHRIYI